MAEGPWVYNDTFWHFYVISYLVAIAFFGPSMTKMNANFGDKVQNDKMGPYNFRDNNEI